MIPELESKYHSKVVNADSPVCFEVKLSRESRTVVSSLYGAQRSPVDFYLSRQENDGTRPT